MQVLPDTWRELIDGETMFGYDHDDGKGRVIWAEWNWNRNRTSKKNYMLSFSIARQKSQSSCGFMADCIVRDGDESETGKKGIHAGLTQYSVFLLAATTAAAAFISI